MTQNITSTTNKIECVYVFSEIQNTNKDGIVVFLHAKLGFHAINLNLNDSDYAKACFKMIKTGSPHPLKLKDL